MSKIPHRYSSLGAAAKPATEEDDMKIANSKLASEILIKNKIIHDLTVEETWKIASTFNNEPSESEKFKLFSLLEKFKVDLEKALEACEQVGNRRLQSKRAVFVI